MLKSGKNLEFKFVRELFTHPVKPRLLRLQIQIFEFPACYQKVIADSESVDPTLRGAEVGVGGFGGCKKNEQYKGPPVIAP